MAVSVQWVKPKKVIHPPPSAIEPDNRTKVSATHRILWQRRYGIALQITDLLVISAAVLLGQMRMGPTALPVSWPTSLVYPIVSILLVGAWMWLLALCHSRTPGVTGRGSEEFRRILAATLYLFGGVAIVSILFKFDLARDYLAVALPLGLVGLSVNRYLARIVVAAIRRRGRLCSSVLAVGEPDSITSLAESLARHREDGYVVVAACAPGRFERGVLEIAGGRAIPLLPYEGEFRCVVKASGADTVVLTSTAHLGPRGIHDLSWQLDELDVDLVVSPAMADVCARRLTIRPLAGVPLIQVAKPRYDAAKCFRKRAFDVCFSLLALTAALPIMLVAAAAIKFTSRGPVFYISQRFGLDGKPFGMIKFRTMVVDANKHLPEVAHLNDCDGLLFKVRHDPRVTSAGRFLRRYSIDELPQFLNVLRKDMSVVGPRPFPVEFGPWDDQARRRLLVRPGITGLWQVSGRSDLSWQDSVRLDESYVENWSMIRDLAITLSTVLVVFRGSGAY